MKMKNKKKLSYELSRMPSMTKVIFDCWLLNLFLLGQVFMFVPLRWGLQIPSFTLQKI
jgi:hypothetical protein